MRQNQFLETYSKFLQKFLKPQQPLKVIFDCSNGTAGLVLKRIMNNELRIKNKKLHSIIHNSKLIILNSEPDGNFPAHGPDPLKPGAVKQLQVAIQKNKADLGIIFDADGDRMFCVDNKSRFIDPDVIARLLTWQLKPKKVIIDVSTGWLIKKLKIPACAGRKNLKIIESKVGHYFIKKMMRTENADFGAEHSGHYYFKEFFGLDSGILAAIEVINAVSKLPYRLSDFVELLPKYYHQEINIGIKQIKPANLLKTVERHYQKDATKISHLDGLTMEFAPSPLEDCEANRFEGKLSSKGEGWWFNLRFSQTEPLVRLNIETTEKSKFQKEVLRLKKFSK